MRVLDTNLHCLKMFAKMILRGKIDNHEYLFLTSTELIQFDFKRNTSVLLLIYIRRQVIMKTQGLCFLEH